MRDYPDRERREYLNERGWNWVFDPSKPIRIKPKRKLFPHNDDLFMRPTITVYGGNEG